MRGELFSSCTFIRQVEPCYNFLGKIGCWLCNCVWNWSLKFHSVAPIKLECLRAFSVTGKHFQKPNFPFSCKTLIKISHFALPFSVECWYSAAKATVLFCPECCIYSSNSLIPLCIQKVLSGHSTCLMPRTQQLLLLHLGRLRYSLASDSGSQEFLDYISMFREYLSLFTERTIFLLWRNTLVVVVQPGEEKVLRGPYYGPSILKGDLKERWRGTFYQGL